MDRGEYWLLDSAVQFRQPFAVLTYEHIDEWFNKPGHGLTLHQLIATLQRLFLSGELMAERTSGFVTERGSGLVRLGVFVPTPSELEAAVAGELDAFYGLTSKGGSRWEDCSAPDWARYLDVEDDATAQIQEVRGANLDVVRHYVSLQPYMTHTAVVAGSEQWAALNPWEATYWKTLPKGHKVRFSYQALEDSDLPDTPQDVTQWLSSIQNWYSPCLN